MAPFKPKKLTPISSTADFAEVRARLREVVETFSGYGDELKKLSKGGLTLGANTPGRLKLLRFQMPASPPFSALPVFSADWKDGSPVAEIMMAPGGVVHMRGQRVAQGAYAAAGAPVGATLEAIPSGYRPVGAHQLPCVVGLKAGGSSWGALSLSTAGVVQLLGAAGNIASFAWGATQWFATDCAAPHQFTGKGWPLVVEHGLTDSCKGLVPLGVRLVGQSGQNAGQGLPVVDWQDLGNGSLRINGAWGLQWSRSYELLCYLTPESEE